MPAPKIHYRPYSFKAFTACGLNVSDLLSSSKLEKVTCGNCRRSGERRAEQIVLASQRTKATSSPRG